MPPNLPRPEGPLTTPVVDATFFEVDFEKDEIEIVVPDWVAVTTRTSTDEDGTRIIIKRRRPGYV